MFLCMCVLIIMKPQCASDWPLPLVYSISGLSLPASPHTHTHTHTHTCTRAHTHTHTGCSRYPSGNRQGIQSVAQRGCSQWSIASGKECMGVCTGVCQFGSMWCTVIVNWHVAASLLPHFMTSKLTIEAVQWASNSDFRHFECPD